MKKIFVYILLLFLSLTSLTSCNKSQNNQSSESSFVGSSDGSESYSDTTSESNNEVNYMEKLKITVGDKELIATLDDNVGVELLKELIRNNPLTINMNDYGGFEKVGYIGTNLPTNDQRITTKTGDIVLYQGNSIVIFYDSNTWSYTRIGKIENITKDKLISVLGTSEVTLTLSLVKMEEK